MNNSSLSSRGWQLWLPLGGFALLWLDLIRQLSYQWSTNDQYAYGWFVPILAAGLFLRRWTDRPGLDVPQVGSVTRWPPSLLMAILVPAFLLLLPLRVIHEVNQDWPLITWPLTAIVVALSLSAVYLKGGWRWVTHFAFPIAFILVAVRWPYRIENNLTQGLMQVVAGLTVELLGWLDVPAFQRGNLIEIGSGVLGVDEACSGIRSFQSTLMAGLFLGELYRLRWPVRLLLVALGLFVAFGLNVARALLLSWEANRSGISAVDKWHDPAGFTIAVACFVVLYLIALLIKRISPNLPTSDPSANLAHPAGEGLGVRASSEVSTASSPPQASGRINLLSYAPWRRFALITGLWAVFCIGATETWYRSQQLRRSDTTQWWVAYPTNLPSFRAVTVSKAAAKLLKHDEESGGSWDEPDGTKWTVYCFRWREGDPAARMSAQGHRPEYCLVGSGHDMVSMSETRYLSANGLSLPFRFYTFGSTARPMHVFFCLWEDGAETQVGFGKTKQGDRLRTALAGRRGMGQQTLEIICTGYLDIEAAENAVRKCLPEIIRVDRLAIPSSVAALRFP